MAANKFATMLHKNTNKFTLILIYAFLEWTLIILLLLNSVFSYITIKFALFFGLSPICFSCARMDRFGYNLCDHHSKEVSQMGLCLNHHKLAEFHDMCENCASSVLGFRKVPKKVVFSKVERIDVIECEDVRLKCSCCDKNFEKNFVDDDDSSCFVSHPLCDNNSVDNDCNENGLLDDGFGSGYDEVTQENEDKKQSEEVETEENEIEVSRELKSFELNLIEFEKGEDLNSHDLKFFTDYSGIQLFPFELPELKTGELGVNGLEKDHEVFDLQTKENEKSFEDEEDHEFGDFQEAQVDSQEIYDYVDLKTEESSKFVENLIDLGDEEVAIVQETQTPLIKTEEFQESDSNIHLGYLEFEEVQKPHVDSQESDYSFGQKREESFKFVENLIEFEKEEVAIEQKTQTLSMDTQELQESDSHIHLAHEEDNVSIGTEIPVLDSCDQIKHEESSTNFNNLDLDTKNDFEDAPETPSSLHSLNPLHKKWLMHETKDSGLEESFDGSVISETDGGDGVNTAEKLKVALKAERKALRDLYLELEEERNASMVAANETMFMINRLQEEKSMMQMEALQYQRMMEEQSEYDQEALQLLNEVMTKKERELEVYRKKVLDYESRFKIGTSSISWSHSEDDDENTLETEGEHTPIRSVLDLQSSLAGFEDERLSILEHLKVLEQRLFALSDEEDRHFSKLTIIEDHYEEIDTYGYNKEVSENTKQLLPLFNAISTGNGNDAGVTVRNGYENGFPSDTTSVTRFELEKKRIDMEEEVDQLYGRLQALEMDKEFLTHCIGSMKKGDKGMELLLEILHHLRDLRDVNLRAKNFADNALL